MSTMTLLNVAYSLLIVIRSIVLMLMITMTRIFCMTIETMNTFVL